MLLLKEYADVHTLYAHAQNLIPLTKELHLAISSCAPPLPRPPPQGEVELDSPRGKEGAFSITSIRTERLIKKMERAEYMTSF